MNHNDIVCKLWKLSNILRDDGISCQQYVSELTSLLFLKLADESGKAAAIPKNCRWPSLCCVQEPDLLSFYKELLHTLCLCKDPLVSEIYRGFHTNIRSADKLKQLIRSLDALDWDSPGYEVLGDIYEGLLEKNAGDKKSGAGQYFTPRVLVDVITELAAPQPMERCHDPACGTFGFMVAADTYVKNSRYPKSFSEEELLFRKKQAFSGIELVSETRQLALMNAFLHDIDADIKCLDTLSASGSSQKGFDVILTNPPFGRKRNAGIPRTDLPFPTGNKQLDFLQHIYGSLRTDTENARAAVIVPDHVLFCGKEGISIRLDLLDKCNLHTILRLPPGIFYSKGIKTNVLFFHRGKSDKGSTKEIWFYDLRTDMPPFGIKHPISREDFSEFMECYKAGHPDLRRETYSADNTRGRWRKYSREEILARENISLDITWIPQAFHTDNVPVEDLITSMEQKAETLTYALKELKDLLLSREDKP